MTREPGRAPPRPPVRSLCGPESLPQSRGSIPHEVQLHLHADVLSRLQVVEPFAASPRSEQKHLLLYVMSRTWYVGIWVPAILTVQWYEGSPEILGQACTSVPNAVIGRWDGGSRWVMAPPCRPTCLGQFLPGGPCHQPSESSVLLPACQLALKKGEGLL